MTAQIPEQLILDGERMAMTFCPSLPDAHPRIVDVTTQRTATSRENSALVNSTACWRRYIGTWEIRERRLYLTHLVGRYELLPGPSLLADWFTGVLRIPRGDVLRYVHMGFGSVFEKELHIDIDAGRVISRRMIDSSDDEDDETIALRNLPGFENGFSGDDEF